MKFLLLPFMWLFVLITRFRNFLYDKNILKTTYFDFPIINVGNLTVGGTGKTPHVEFLVRFFLENNQDIDKNINQNISQKYQINVLSRGYGRKTKGFLLANSETSATEIGDEPRQYFEKFGDKINVVVCENRVLGATLIQDFNQNLDQNLHQNYQKNKRNLIILDDAFQHRAIGRNVNILLTDYKRLFYNDFPFPVGRLREQRKNAQRADFIIVSKCNSDISKEKMNEIEAQIHAYTGTEKPAFFTKITYGNPVNLITNLEEVFNENQNLNLILLSGIAQPQLFEDFCKENLSQKNTLKKHFIFPDHHQYTQKNINEIVSFIENLERNNTQNNTQNSNKNIKILTTEKDAVKLRKLLPEKLKNLFYFLPITVDFIDKKEEFLQMLLIKTNKLKS